MIQRNKRMCDVIMEVFRRISTRIKEEDAIELDMIKEKREKETKKQVTMAELVREFVSIGIKAKKDGMEAETDRIKKIQKDRGEEPEIQTQDDECQIKDKFMETPEQQVGEIEFYINAVKPLEDKVDNLTHEMSDVKELLQNIITTVSYPKELEALNKMKDSLEFIESKVEDI